MLEINKIYHMDCIKFLQKIDNASIDLAVLDPPYNMSKADWDIFKCHDDFLNFSYQWIDLIIDKLKNTGSLYIFNTPYNSAFILQYLVSKGLIFQNWITWDKRDGLGYSKSKFANGQETILFFVKSNKHTFNAEDIRIPYESTSRIAHASKKGILKNGKRWFPNSNGKLCGEVWHFSSQRHKQKVNGKTPKLKHITPKPIDLVHRIIKASSNENDIVLDCFVGSGTTAIASFQLNRNFLCADQNIEYVKLANERLKNGL